MTRPGMLGVKSIVARTKLKAAVFVSRADCKTPYFWLYFAHA